MWLLNTIKKQSIFPVIQKKKRETRRWTDHPSGSGQMTNRLQRRESSGEDASNSVAPKSLEENWEKKGADKPSVDNEGTVVNISRNICKPN